MTTRNVVPLLTVEELAELLQVPRATVYQWRSTGRGPRGVRVGRHVRYRRAEVERWLAEQEDRGAAPA
jgi:excisionase family DNA binding protein